jgi:hypothetical protein
MRGGVAAALAQGWREVLHLRDHLALGVPDAEVADIADRRPRRGNACGASLVVTVSATTAIEPTAPARW